MILHHSWLIRIKSGYIAPCSAIKNPFVVSPSHSSTRYVITLTTTRAMVTYSARMFFHKMPNRFFAVFCADAYAAPVPCRGVAPQPPAPAPCSGVCLRPPVPAPCHDVSPAPPVPVPCHDVSPVPPPPTPCSNALRRSKKSPGWFS